MGYDPYFLEFLGKFKQLYYRYFPYPMLVFYFLKRRIIPKALGLIIRGNVSMYKVLNDVSFLEKNDKLIQILIEHSQGTAEKYLCWGWPFSWKSGLGPTFPKDYPIAIVTSEIGHSFLDQYEANKKASLLRACKIIADFLIKENGYARLGDTVCFYYSNLHKYLVTNVNTYVASFLTRLNTVSNNYLSLRSIDFTLSQQNENGSWYYYAYPLSEKNKVIDNRHTGYTLVALKCANKELRKTEIEKAIDRGWNFYKTKLMRGAIPKHSPDTLYPIDMHDIAQAIITSCELGDLKLANAISNWAIDNMSNLVDEFYFQMNERSKIIRLVFFRWTQAWMYRALSLLLEKAKTLTGNK